MRYIPSRKLWITAANTTAGQHYAHIPPAPGLVLWYALGRWGANKNLGPFNASPENKDSGIWRYVRVAVHFDGEHIFLQDT